LAAAGLAAGFLAAGFLAFGFAAFVVVATFAVSPFDAPTACGRGGAIVGVLQSNLSAFSQPRRSARIDDRFAGS
jgi:hypothetical protein